MVSQERGDDGLPELLVSGRSNEELKTALVSLLGMAWDDLEVRWRERVLELGGQER